MIGRETAGDWSEMRSRFCKIVIMAEDAAAAKYSSGGGISLGDLDIVGND